MKKVEDTRILNTLDAEILAWYDPIKDRYNLHFSGEIEDDGWISLSERQLRRLTRIIEAVSELSL